MIEAHRSQGPLIFMNVYLDESGDLGWTLDKPFGSGGSSRYLSIATLIVPKTISHLPKRIIKKTYKERKQHTSKELKGHELTKEERIKFAERVRSLVTREPAIQISVITVKKKNVQPHIRTDANKLYNYMIKFALLEKIKTVPHVDFIPDPRTLKVQSGNSQIDYLQTTLWFEYNSSTVLNHAPMESQRNLNLQFTDFIANIVWRFYEFNRSEGFNILKKHLFLKHLFF